MDNIFLKSKNYGGSYVNAEDGTVYLYQQRNDTSDTRIPSTSKWVRTILTAEVLNELKLISDRSMTEGGDNNA